MKIKMIENWKGKPYREKIIVGETKEECFIKIYELFRSERYVSISEKTDFANIEDYEEYQKWKPTYNTIEHYYGSSVVD